MGVPLNRHVTPAFSVSSSILLVTFVVLEQGRDGGKKVSRLNFQITRDPPTLVSTFSTSYKLLLLRKKMHVPTLNWG